MKIAVCALTFRRPDGLAALLHSLGAMTVPADCAISTTIVDNDPHASAEPLVIKAAATFPHTLTYVHEPTPGIAAARNTAVHSNPEADFIAFIDDDEEADPDWLTEFVATHRATGAEVVTGPVFPKFASPPPRWVIDGAFFERPRFAHNSPIRWATTSSVLMSRRAADAVPGPFDAEFGLSGGEDTLLFRQLRDAGFSMAWCDRALVTETIPDSRVSLQWITMREYRRGQTLSLVVQALDGSRLRRLGRFGRGLGEVAAGVVMLPVGTLRAGRTGAYKAVHRVAFGAGMLTGSLGYKYLEYAKNSHGS